MSGDGVDGFRPSSGYWKAVLMRGWMENRTLFLKRISQFQKYLGDNDFGGALLAYSREILYYTGTAQPAFLAITPDDYALFIKSGMDYAVNDVFIDVSKLVEERKMANVHQSFFAGLKNRRIGLELDIISALEFMECQRLFKDATFENISPAILSQRAIKDSFEIEQIRKAGEVTKKGYEAACDVLKPGITELELSAAVEQAHRLAGHEGTVFFRVRDFFMGAGPIGAGESLKKHSGILYSLTGTGQSASVPIGPSKRPIKSRETVIIDIPCHINGYQIDHTRSFVAGRARPETRACYEALKEVFDFLIEDVIRPGVKCSDIYAAAIEKSRETDFHHAFLKFSNGKRSLLVGHGLGMEVNEAPVIFSHNKQEIAENNILAVELHMMDDKAGVLKLEDTIHVGKEGNELLTISPRELFESGHD